MLRKNGVSSNAEYKNYVRKGVSPALYVSAEFARFVFWGIWGNGLTVKTAPESTTVLSLKTEKAQ